MLRILTSLFLFGITFSSLGQQAELITQEKNLGLITCIVYNSEGSYIASGSEGDHKIKVWDVQSGKIVGILSGHESSINSVDFHPNGETLVSASKKGKIYIWDLTTWTVKDSVTNILPLQVVRFTPDGKYLIGGGKGGGIMSWENGNWDSKKRIGGHNTGVSVISFDDAGKMMVSGSKAGGVIVWDAVQLTETKKINAHKRDITGLGFVNNGSRLVTSSMDKTIKFWNTSGFTLDKTITEKNTVTSMGTNNRRKVFATGGADKMIKVWSAETGEKLYELDNKAENRESGKRIDESVRAITFSPDGGTMATSGFRKGLFNKVKSEDNVIKIWDVSRKSLFKSLEGEVNPVDGFCFHPVDNKLVTLSGLELALWDLNLTQRFGSVTLEEPHRERNEEKIAENKTKTKRSFLDKVKSGNLGIDINKTIDNTTNKIGSSTEKTVKRSYKENPILLYSGKGNYFVTRIPKDEVRLYEVKDGIPTHKTPVFHEQAHVNDMIADPSEKYLICAGTGADAISIIDIKTGKLSRKLETMKDRTPGKALLDARVLAMDKAGTMLAAAFGNGKIMVWRVGNWSVLFESKLNIGALKAGAFVNFSEDGSILYVKTPIGVLPYSTKKFDPFDEKKPQMKGKPLVIHTPAPFLVTKSKDRLYFANLEKNEVQQTTAMNTKNLSHLEINKNGKVGASFLNGEFRLYDPSTGKEVVIMVGEGENVIFKTPENYYKVTKGGYDLVTFRVGKDAYPFEQFDVKFNRPDIVLAAMDCEDESLIRLYKKAYEKRLKKLGLTEAQLGDEMHLPEASITNKKDLPLVTQADHVNLNVALKDDKYKISRLNVWVNNVPVYGAKGLQMNGEATKDVKVQLCGGLNKVQVSAVNEKGGESLKSTVEVTVEKEVKRNLYIVSIGTSQYQDNRYNLNYAAKDANDIANLFKTNKGGVYESVQEKVMTNAEVRKDNFKALKEFLKGTKVDDVVIVFLAGHGVLDADFDYYYGTHDINFQNPETQGLEYSEIEAVLDGIAALKKLLIMDTCHSGEVEKDDVEASTEKQEVEGDVVFRNVGTGIKEKDENAVSPTKMMKELFADLRRGTGTTVISSAGGAEYAMESSEWKNGLFTYCLLFGLKNGGADLDKNGEVMLSELQTYVKERVSDLSHGKQIPTTRIENLTLDYRIW
jgi:WD40 repeat protein/uncharacterized caspase-like protein